MAEVYTEPTPSAFGPRPTDPGTPVPLDGDGTTTLDGIAAAFSRENYVAGAASAASARAWPAYWVTTTCSFSGGMPALPAAAWMAGVSPVVQSRLPAVGLSKNR